MSTASFRITLTASGDSFAAAADEALLEAALRQGRQLPYGCRDGQCGSCKARVAAGQVTHDGKSCPALTESERQAGWCLCCQARALSDVTLEVRVADSHSAPEVRTLPARVARMQRLSHDVLGIWLQLPQNERLAFRAGQYIDILLRNGLRRSFSLANAPHDDEFLQLNIRHVPGGAFAEYVLDALQEKQLLRIRGPYGRFTLHEDSARPLVFIAGGTGFAPIKGLLEHAFARGLQQPITLYWGVRAARDIYSPLHAQWSRSHPNFSFVPVLSDPLPEDNWNGQRGFVHEALAEAHGDLSGFDVYTSGPPVMVRAVAQICRERGLPEARFYTDSFEFAAKQSSRTEG